VPLAVPLAMKAVFRATTRRLGSRRGYQSGFPLYCGHLLGCIRLHCLGLVASRRYGARGT
jgi:hypothetical protein